MSEIGTHKLDLNSGFPVWTREDWQTRATRSLAGRPVSELCSRTADGIMIDPLYERVAEPPVIPGMPSSPPLVMPLVIENEPDAANAAVLSELAGGAGGVVLQIEAPGQPGIAMTPEAIHASLSGVQLDTATLSLATGEIDWPQARDGFATLIDRHGESARGINLGVDPIGAALNSRSGNPPAALAPPAQFAQKLAELPSVTLFSASGVPAHEAGATEAQELAAMLASGIAYLRALEDAGHSTLTASRWIGLDLSVDGDVFVSIAKLRAARLLWFRCCDLCGSNTHRPHLHARTSARMMAARETHVNILRTAAAALAATTGGADSVTVLPFTHTLGKPDAPARRIARNQMIVLAEESYLGTVADPAAGSGYIEYLTGELAARAWAVFQNIEAAGGAASMRGVDLMRGIFGEAAKAREARFTSGARRIVGVNAFRNADDQPPVTEPWPS